VSPVLIVVNCLNLSTRAKVLLENAEARTE
jgi:hypothetical protein